MFKTARFWLTLFAASICIFNFFAYDDKNLILVYTSPHLMLLEDYSPYVWEIIPTEQMVMLFIYFINILGWFLIGWLMDFAKNYSD